MPTPAHPRLEAAVDAYPLPPADEDPRFNFGLMLDMEKVLVAHGYPAMSSGADHVRLRLAMYRMMYGTETP